MQISEQTARLLQRINAGDYVTDLGGISDQTKRAFKRMVAKGQLIEVVDIFFPKHKRAWIGAALPVEDWPACIVAK